MAEFQFRAMSPTGEITAGELTAENKFDAVSALRSRNLRPISVDEKGGGIGDIKIGKEIKRLSLKSLLLFCRQLATLLRAGVPLIQCFDIIASQSSDKYFKATLLQISADIQSGSVLSVAIEKQGEKFPPMLSKMIAIGEETGDMPSIVERVADQYESDNRIRSRIKGALTYPIVLMVVALGAAVFMLIKIVPQFADIFNSLDTELPGLTKALMAVSGFLTQRWYLAIIIIPTVVILLIRFFRLEKVVRWVDEKKLTMKGLSGPMQKLMAASFSRTLFTLVASGIPIVQALQSTKENINNVIVREAIDEISVGIQKGKGLSEQLKNYPYFPSLMISMVSIGEASGNLEEMLSKTAEYYDEEMDAAIGQLMTILEPVMILLVGGIIGVIVMALYAPMFGAISALQNGI